MDYLTLWKENVVTRTSMSLREPTEIEGLCDANLGPRWEFAKIRLRAEPSDRFEARVELGSKRIKFEKEGYSESAILGVLDALLVSGQSPLRNVRVTLVDAEDHEVDSSPNAFRLAGREAGKKLLEVTVAQMLKR